MLSNLLHVADRAMGGAMYSSPLDQYQATLTGGTDIQVTLERNVRLLHMFANLGDGEGQVQACDTLTELCRSTRRSAAKLVLDQALIDQGALTSLLVLLRTERVEPCRAAAELLTELTSGAEQRRALVRSGVLQPLLERMRRTADPRLLREGARLVAELSADAGCTAALLREQAPRALLHLCRSRALPCHELAVIALGRLSRADAALHASGTLTKTLIRVAEM
jgi:hypothetical protein